MSARVSIPDLAAWINCKPTQRCIMIRWLKRNHWVYDIDRAGFPAVSQAYFDRKTGATETKQSAKYADSPNLTARA